MATKLNEKVDLKKRFFSSRLFLFIMLGLAVLVAIGYARAYYQDYKIKQEIKKLQEDIDFQSKKQIKSLEILKYVSSTSYTEDQARIELNMKKPGENVIFVNSIENVDSKDDNLETIENIGQFISNKLKWLYYFIHKPLPTEEK